MVRALPALRRNLDVMPSPVEDRPGVLLRDPFRYTEDVLIVPPALVPFLGYFDGAHDEGDLRLALRRDAAVGWLVFRPYRPDPIVPVLGYVDKGRATTTTPAPSRRPVPAPLFKLPWWK